MPAKDLITRSRQPVTLNLHQLIPPVKGVFDAGGMTQIKDTYCLSIQNWIPRLNFMEIRKGWTVRNELDGHTVMSALQYSGTDGGKLIGICSDDTVWDLTTPSAEVDITPEAPADILNFSENWYSGLNFKNNLFIYSPSSSNTTEEVYAYDGTNIANAGFTYSASPLAGITTITVHQRRLFFGCGANMNIYYTALPDSVTGDCGIIDMSTHFSRGGTIKAIASWTRDGGAGVDDFLIILTSEGEIAVYQGTDPTSADAAMWSLIGTWDTGSKPVSSKCINVTGQEVIVATIDGIFQLTGLFNQSSMSDYSSGITITYGDLAPIQADLDYWAVIPSRQDDLMLIVVPRNAATNDYTIFGRFLPNGAWTVFSELPAQSIEHYDTGLIACLADGRVVNIFSGYSDGGEPIVAAFQTAYRQYGKLNHQVKAVSPIFQINDIDPDPVVKVKYDFELFNKPDVRTSVPTPTAGTSSGVGWDSVLWDTSYWGTSAVKFSPKIGQTGMGNASSMIISAASLTAPVFLTGINVYWQEMKNKGYFIR